MKKEEINMRFACKKDIDAIVFLMREGFSYIIDKTIYGCYGIENYIVDNLSNPVNAYIVVEYQGKISGVVEYRILNDVIFLNYIVLGVELKGKGFASQIFESSLNILSSKRNKIILDVFTNNYSAIGWYEKIGFNRLYFSTWNEVLIEISCLDKSKYKLINKKNSEDKFQRYGFTTFEFQNCNRSYSVGLLGEKWIRITDNSILYDSKAMSSVINEFPNKSIFSITDNNIDQNHFLKFEHIIDSIRMER
jgi:N-acetylglutamate synthase-like GNAT family acetyltransferase